MKKLLSVLSSTLRGGIRGGLLFLALIATTSLWAQRFQSGDLYYNITSDSTVQVTRTTNDLHDNIAQYVGLTDVVIPEAVIYNGVTYNVTSILSLAFDGCSTLTSISIPNSVTEVGGGVFAGCTSLKEVTLPNNLQELPWYLYYDPHDEVYKEAGFFENCTSLTTINIPDQVRTIGDKTFKGCSNLVSISIPDSITSIGAEVFEDTPWYNNLPDGELYFNRVFYKYKGSMPENTSIEIAEGTISVSSCAFRNRSNLISVVIPNSVMIVGAALFAHCGSLEKVVLPQKITILGSYCTWYCPFAYTASTYDGFFENCSSLKSITLPSNITYIAEDAFYSCNNLDTIYSYPSTPPSFAQYAFKNTTISKIFVHNKSLALYTQQWKGIAENFSPFVGEAIFSSKIEVSDITQTKAKIKAIVTKTDSAYSYNAGYILKEDTIYVDYSDTLEFTVTNLSPNQSNEVTLFVGKADEPIDNYVLETTNIKTESINLSVQIGTRTQTTAKITLSVNAGDATAIEQGIIFTHPNKQTDTIPFEINQTDTILTELAPGTSYSIVGYCKIIEDNKIYTSETTNIKTESINLSVQIGTITQTTAKITLNCSAGDATPIERGIILTHPDGRKDTIPFEINQTDTTIRGLVPYSNYVASGYCTFEGGNQILASNSKFTTKNIGIGITTESKTQTTLRVGVHCTIGDATIYDKGLIVHFPYGKIDTISIMNSYINPFGQTSGDTLFTQLRIDMEYDMYGFVRTKEGGLYVSNGYAIYTKNIESTITSSNRTQTTVSLSASLGLGDATDYNKNGLQWTVGSSFNSYNYETIYFKEGVYELDTILTHLSPNTQYTFRLFHYSVDERGEEYCVYGDTRKFTTASVVLSEPTLQTTGQTYIEVQTSSAYGDATLLEEVVEVATSKYSTPEQRVTVAGRNNVIINNLMPDTKYFFRSVLTTQEAGTMQSEWYEATTEPITLATGEADGISNSSAFLHGTIDCDTMSRTEIGFEWKRSDAPSTVKPQRLLVVDRVDENLIFRLEGLSSDRYYDFRTFCLYNGKEYYGEWVGFLTSDKDILIPPSVQTREAEITELGVLMKGFVVAGTEVILQRGFECWREGSDQVATTVAEGAVMSSYIPEAWSYTTYKYRAYAKTPAGTTYGETLEVTTEYIATNIADIIVNASSNSAQVTWTMVEQADYYILTLYSDESMTEVIGVYTVDKNGNVTQKRVASATQSLVTCELTELLPETNYYFAVKAYNSDDQKVAEENGSFATTVVPTYVENTHTQSPMTDCQKIIRNGQLLILRDGVEYTIMGAEIK